MSETIQVEHLARIEGHAGITVELDGGAVRDVRFDIFEGARLLEALVRGRSCEDVAPIVSRICAICSVAHTLTSLKATENAFGVEVSPQTELLRDLLYRGENIESHALHLFCLAVPDYLNLPSAIALAAVNREAVLLGLRLKKLGNSIQEVIGGRAIHPVNAVLGGFARLPGEDDLIALRQGLLQGVTDCQTMIDLLATLPDEVPCDAPAAMASLYLDGDYGYYRGSEILVQSNGSAERLPVSAYRSLTNEKSIPHSHAKHSSYKGKPLMVGALARLSARQQNLNGRAAEAMRKLGLGLPSRNLLDNNLAQAVELVLDVDYALQTVEKLLARGSGEEARVPVHPGEGAGSAATEAPRGLLFHSYTYDAAGRAVAADVITPTALNAASIEDRLRATAEQASGTALPALRKKLEMVARAYDPCVSCSVHVLQIDHAG